MADDDYTYLRDKVDSIFKKTEQIPVIILRLDGLNDFKAKCEEDRDEFDNRVKVLETESVSDGKVEEFKEETRKNRRWIIGIFITVLIFVGTMIFRTATTKSEELQTEPQYCNCNYTTFCDCDRRFCGCIECRTMLEKEN